MYFADFGKARESNFRYNFEHCLEQWRTHGSREYDFGVKYI